MQASVPLTGPCADTPPVAAETQAAPYLRGCAVMETLAFLTLAVGLDAVFGDGTRFLGAGLHPFWIIVLLVTLQYGTGEALVTAILASVFLVVGNLPEQMMTETMYEYIFRVTWLPLLWIMTALALGSLRTRQLRERDELKTQLEQARQALQTVVNGYNTVKQAKEQLEMRLAEERCSVLTVYKIARSLETYAGADVLCAVTELVKVALRPAKFSLWRIKSHALALEAFYGWDRADEFSHSFKARSALAERVVKQQDYVSITSEQDEPLLAGQGVLAGPIRDVRTGRIYGMLKIEEMAFADLGIHSQEIFRVVCDWIGHVYASQEKRPAVQAGSLLQIPESLVRKVSYARRSHYRPAA